MMYGENAHQSQHLSLLSNHVCMYRNMQEKNTTKNEINFAIDDGML